MSSRQAARIPAPLHPPVPRGRGGQRRLRVGVLELIAYTVASEWLTPPVVGIFKRQLYAIMPQVVATWARQLGHRVTYATYYGQRDPVELLPPGEFDVVIIATSTQGSALAYALAALYRASGVRTVIGGAHAASYPEDCARFFDTVVTRCDKALLAALLSDDPAPGSILGCGRGPVDLPSVEERLPDIATAAFRPDGMRPRRTSVISLLASLGCPYDCGFCTDWDSIYRPRPADAVAADLAFVARRFPGTLLGFHDPNFGVRLDDSLDLLDAVPADRRSPYPMQCSMSALTPRRIGRLGATRCLYVAPDLESWAAFGGKLRMRGGQAAPEGPDRVAGMAARFEAMHRHVPGLQANFVLGLDTDLGDEPFDLTRAFLRRTPYAWPNINILTPYGGTPFQDALRQQGRLLTAMPLALLCSPYLTFVPQHYDALGFYDRLIALLEDSVAPGLTLGRALLRDRLPIKLSRLAQTIAVRRDVAEMRLIRDALRTDRELRAFHAGRGAGSLPPIYRTHLLRRLGRFAPLLPAEALRPLLPAATVPDPATRARRCADAPTSRGHRQPGQVIGA